MSKIEHATPVFSSSRLFKGAFVQCDKREEGELKNILEYRLNVECQMALLRPC